MTARTEPPTPRRLREARRRGEIGASRDLAGAGALVGGLTAVVVTGPASARALGDALRSGIAVALDGTAVPGAVALDALRLLARVSSAPLAAAMAGALVLGSVQAQGLFTIEAIRLRWERIDPLRAGARLVASGRLAAVALGVVRASVLLVVGWHVTRGQLRSMAALPRLAPGRLVPALGGAALGVLGPIAATSLAFGIVDAALARRRHRESLRMTRDEVRREQRDEQGDPQHRAERRRAHRALSTAAPLRQAACVVVNPTHVAVALHHDRAADGAPVVVAKGMGRAAAALRSAARRAGVPIVEDVALARALFRLAEIGEEIPEDLYEAAAVVLAEIYRGAEASP